MREHGDWYARSVRATGCKWRKRDMPKQAAKIAWIAAIAAAGVTGDRGRQLRPRPRSIPQMADTEAVVRAQPRLARR